MNRTLRLSLALLFVISVLAGCDLLLFGPGGTGLRPGPGRYRESIFVEGRNNDARYYYSNDPLTPPEEFERFFGMDISGDTTFWYYVVEVNGSRSGVIEAEYTITDSSGPTISTPGVQSFYREYYGVEIAWFATEGGPGGGGGDPSPRDDNTPWEELEFSAYSSSAANIATIEDAMRNGRLEFAWTRLTSNFPEYFAQHAFPGERRWYNVFVRDADGNVSDYGQSAIRSNPAISIVLADPGGAGTRTRLNDNVWDDTLAWSGLDFSTTLAEPAWLDVVAMEGGDVTGDGIMDLALVYDTGPDFESILATGLGNGRYTTGGSVSRLRLPEGSAPLSTAIRIVDMNRDGTPDIVIGDENGRLDVISHLTATIASIDDTGSGRFITDFTVGDLNGDLYPDIVSLDSAQTDPNRIRVHLNQAGSGFTGTPGAFPFTLLTGTAGLDVELGDFDGDGALDIAVSTNNPAGGPSVEFFYGNGDGTFEDDLADPLGGGPGVVHIAVADFGGAAGPDGIDDLFVGTGFGDDSVIVPSNGDRTFATPVSTGNAADSVTALVEDFNHDGLPDVLQAFATGAPRLWMNTGVGVTELSFAVPFAAATHIAAGRVR